MRKMNELRGYDNKPDAAGGLNLTNQELLRAEAPTS